MSVSRALLVSLIVSVGLSGCARLNDPYQASLEKSYSGDSTALSGDFPFLHERLIAIDAGHGGSETGAKGPNGLLEKDVNLGVALALSRMLEKAGAKVLLTRTGDRVLKSDSSTRDELSARMELVNQADPDLFLSIHHNATLDPASKADETQTYYRMDDPGASLDAARAIHHRLVSTLALPKEKILPGNYLVLRSCRAPAILGEASFITNPVLEKKLSQVSRQELEAKAYFLGIADYFERGVPSLEWIPTKISNRPVFEARFITDGSPIDPSTIFCTLDERNIPFYYDASGFFSAQPEGRLGNGSHRIRIEARNNSGNSARPLESTFTVSEPPRSVKVRLPFPSPPKDGPLPVEAKVLDAGGFPVVDGTEVNWRSNTGHFLLKDSRTLGGIATNYLVETEKDPVVVLASAGKVKGRFQVPSTSERVAIGQVLDPKGQPISGAFVTAIGRDRSPQVRSNAEGYFWFYPLPAGLREVRVEAGGYQRMLFGARDSEFLQLELRPAFSGALNGRKILLEPLADGADGWRNWQVASYLKGYLKVAGAEGILSRRSDEAEDALESVRLANRLQADLFLAIGSGEKNLPVRAEHYPSSVFGKQWAERIADNFYPAGTDKKPSIRPSSFYPLVQAACPAVAAFLGAGAFEDLSACRRDAYRLFLAFLPSDPQAATLAVKLVYSRRAPAVAASVLLDESWPGQSDAKGEWVFKNLAPGRHFLTASDGLFSRGFWVLDLKPGEARTMEVVLDRPELPSDLSFGPCLGPS